MSDKLYQPPQHEVASQAPSQKPMMTWAIGVAIVLGTTVAGGLAGLGTGAALGMFVPGYYRSVVRARDHPAFDPVAVGSV